VWVHGGAFVAGDLDMPESNWIAMELAAQGITVLALDYRKAVNGVHHPEPVDDILVAWRAAAADVSLWRDDVVPVHLGGASAGATISSLVALRAARDGLPVPASLVLIYPLMHREMPEASAEAASASATIPVERQMSPAFMAAINSNYLGDDASTESLAFPSDGDFSSLPPTLVVTAEADELRASGERFIRELSTAGGTVVGDVERGTLHGYLNEPGHPGALATIDRIVAWLSTAD
jgi:acetyl esterase/lipase